MGMHEARVRGTIPHLCTARILTPPRSQVPSKLTRSDGAAQFLDIQGDLYGVSDDEEEDEDNEEEGDDTSITSENDKLVGEIKELFEKAGTKYIALRCEYRKWPRR